MKKLSGLLILAATPAFAAGDVAFFSLRNTNLIVLLAFLLFIGVLVYFKVPTLIGALLDKRAAGIKSDLDEARALHEEAKTLLASYERKSREVRDLADQIVTSAKRDAQAAADQAKVDLASTIARRVKAAEEQIASAEAGALRQVKDRAVTIAVAAASELLRKQLSADDKAKLMDASITEVETRLH
ncbi:F0F1 ATP synthase subunit B [Phaeovulum sp. W22_SRMD_FR3]|uniref:F0F1 ATP synthase subunit B n=1 Tax=Phaeovulum sp. W22_SRMD_FR3 TaxID=3240274 RepID=UPI003F9C5F6F